MNRRRESPWAPSIGHAWLPETIPHHTRFIPLFYPRSVAVVGASPKGGYGLRVISALTSYGFAGNIYPVNPNYDEIAGLKAYPEIGAIPEPVDAVAIAVPSRAVPGVVQQAIAAGAKERHRLRQRLCRSG